METSSGISVDDVLLIVAALALYAVFAKQFTRMWITAALFLTAVGALSGAVGWFHSQVSNDAVQLLASIALATVLFGDATRVQLSTLKSNAATPIRLLTIGLLGTMLLGMLFAPPILGGLTWPIALILAVILAPTDAALGASVVENTAVPAKVRQSLFVESGLNDGLAVPVLVIALAWADLGDSPESVAQLLAFKLVLSPIVGIALALLAYGGLRLARHLGGVEPSWSGLVPLLTALATFLLTEHLEGSGFIAAFVGGVTFGAVTKARAEEGIAVDESVSNLLQGSTWFLFGALAVAPLLLTGVPWSWVLYAVLSLTVVRMIPVAAALIGTHHDWRSVLFMGWFGPRGLASVVFLMIVLGMNPADSDARIIAGVATLTVVASIVLHGLSAPPLAVRFGARESHPPDRLTPCT